MTVIEIARFRLAVGADERELLREDDRVQREYVPRQPGFISRETARGEDGEWLVLVHWQTERDADASMSKFMDDPTTRGFVGMLDGSTVSMKRYSLVQGA